MKNLKIATALVLALSATAHAEKESGGADAIICKVKKGGETVHLADVYPLARGGGLEALASKVEKYRPGYVTWSALSVIGSYSREEASAITQIMRNFRYETNEKLPELDDDGIKEVPDGCEKTQLAIQTYKSGLIEVKTSLRNRLSILEQGLFPIHEAYIKYYAKEIERTGNTAIVRDALYKIISSPLIIPTLTSDTPPIWFLIRVEDGVDPDTGKYRTAFKPQFDNVGVPQGVFRGTLLAFANFSKHDCTLVETLTGTPLYDTMWAKYESMREGKWTGHGYYVVTQPPGTVITYRCAERPWHETGLIVVF